MKPMRILKYLFVLIIVIALIGGGWYISLTRSFDAGIIPGEDVFFSIEEGSTLTKVAHSLEDNGIIAKASSLLWLARLEGEKAVLAADYQFPPEFTLRDLYRAITEGEALSLESQVTLIEGLNTEEIAGVFEKKGLVSSADEFVAAVTSNLDAFKKEFDFLATIPVSGSLEGYLFPDTYRFFDDATSEDIMRRMLNNLDNKLNDKMRSAIEKSGRTIHEVMTLASIIEKEVPEPEDMKTIAGIFVNRLDIGMALQADSTINYLTKSGRDRSTQEDLEIDSLYNTYKYPGLTPGPISNPGLNAIKAAIYPDDTDYLYFLTDKAGKVYYAESFAEHQENRKYLNNE